MAKCVFLSKKSLKAIPRHHFNDLHSYNAYESGRIVPTTPAERQGWLLPLQSLCAFAHRQGRPAVSSPVMRLQCSLRELIRVLTASSTSCSPALLWAHSAQCEDNLHSLQTPGNLQDLMLRYLLAHIKKDLSKISSAANQIKSTQFFAVVDRNLFCQFFLLS